MGNLTKRTTAKIAKIAKNKGNMRDNMHGTPFLLLILAFTLTFTFGLKLEASELSATPSHAIAMHGIPKYKKDFTHFDYLNPDAPKGGALNLYAFGTFDSLNPFILKGHSADGLGLTFDTLMISSADEPFTRYGLIAESIEVPKDRSFAAFNINPKAKFHDGTPITAEDVVFTFNILREKGSPLYRFYYANVESAISTSPSRVLFTFKKGADNRELPLILSELPVLSKADMQGKDFTATTLTPFLGSGAYKVAKIDQGRYITYERVKDYWAKDLPVNRGKNNFDTVKYDYYRDTSVSLEAFKAGAFDLRIENEAKKWGTGYDFPAVAEGKVILREFKHQLPSGMQGFVFNTRRPLFADRKVRQALSYAFDFEWSNKNLFYGLYHRTKSYFDNSVLAATGAPTKAELKLLEPYKDIIPPEVFLGTCPPPETDGSGDIRDNLIIAMNLLKEAGWEYKSGALRNKDGEPFIFEIMLDTSGASAWERITLPFVRNLKRLGIEAKIRVVDLTQYQARMNTFDFDMATVIWGQSLSPGNEQRSYWGSNSAAQNGSRNYIGITDKAIDAMIESIISAPSESALISATHALDRILQCNYFVIPHWHSKTTKIAFWDKFGMPSTTPMQGMDIMSWWIKSLPQESKNKVNKANKEVKE